MAFLFNNPQRPVLPHVVEALQRLQDDPQQLAHERDRRYDDPPPPYSESGETTQPPTPGPPVVDESYQRELRMLARYKSTPLNQFKSQARRERERLEHQLSEERFGRRQTLLWDQSSDLQANSENNVRSRWSPAWPKDSHLMSTWSHRGGGPFSGPYNATTSESWPGARWGHKENDREPESEPESEPKSEPEQERPPIFGIFGLGVGQPKRPRPRRQLPPGPVPIYLIPTPTVRNPEASRPYDQFLYQITKERDWIKDETDYKQPGSAIDLDAVAYQGVKKNWIKNGIWNPKWDDLPGRTWIYEEPEEEVVVEAPAASDDSGRRPSDTADDRQQTHGPRHPSLFRPAPIPEVTNGRTDGGPTRAPGGAEASNAEGRPSGRTRESSSRQLTVTHGTQDPEQPPRRSLRSARPSQAETGGSSAATCLSSPPCQSKRSRCSDAVEHEQPPKRPRHNTRHSVLSSHNASDTNKESHNSKTVVTKGATPSCDEMATSTSRGTGGKRVTAVSNPLRRSARIAERERKQPTDVSAELQRGRSSTATTKTATTKTAKRGRPGRGDQHDISTPKRDGRKRTHIARAKARK
ncbi:hypothetical protein BGZ61DRAFT_491617 [Ilyonectria robusta]|uniref:uncharacterized protein n=1 Tax=Ilyonectria robusta TaxID=1079257 RepID=UPI001E8EB0FE|nr:uncharacterized protein BGZ61DRAFT_491617 [Ilyonectria robusta]KAH8729166.1 hypothetical protein BGZ61DRAFT_491617 [Ilyonectria robusta]